MTDSTSNESIQRWLRLAPWLLVVVGVLTYVNTLPNDFVFDDTGAILANQQIRDPANIPFLVFNDSRWLPEITLAINWAIDGDEPRGYHLVNLIIHILAAVTLYGLVRRVLSIVSDGSRQSHDKPAWRLATPPSPAGPSLLAFAIALLWLVHPLNTQAVTYVIQRHESMMGLFYLLTLYGTVRTAQAMDDLDGETAADADHPPRRQAVWGWGIATVLACAAGLSSKQVMVTAPVLALLLDRAFLSGSLPAALRRRWGLYLGLALTWNLIWINGSLQGIAREGGSAGFGMQLVSWYQYLLSQGEIILHYLRLVVWPHPLVLDYMWVPAALVTDPGYRLLHIWIPCATVALLLGVSLVGLFRNTWWGFLGFAFFAILSVTSSVVPIADLAMEHRMYLPLAAVLTLVILAADKAIRRWTPPETRGQVRLAGAAAGLLVVVVLAGLTVQRNFEYRTGVTIWNTVIERAPYNPRGFHNLGKALNDYGRDDEAMAAYEHAVVMVPGYADAHHNMGNIWMSRNQPQRALQRYEAAVEARPSGADNHYGLATALAALGRIDEAWQAVNRAIELKPTLATAWDLRGTLRARQGDLAGAVQDISHAIELSPDDAEMHYNLGLTLKSMGEHVQAAAALERAIELDPREPRPMQALARLRATSPDDAVRDGHEALRLVSQVQRLRQQVDVPALDTLAAAYAEVGEFGEARRVMRRALDTAAAQDLPDPLIEQMRQRLSQYEQQQPYREP